MYFKSRFEAGLKLAEKLDKYRYENCAVVALSDGGVLVAAQIAMRLHCVMTLLLTEPVSLPGEHEPLLVVNQDGAFTYNNKFSSGQLEAFTSEYRGVIEQSLREKFHEINSMLGSGGIISPDLLRGHKIILVSDGLNNALSIDAAAAYLKPIKTEKIIIATPLASVPSVDRMHLAADEICCLSVVDNYMDTDHYYENNAIPSHEAIINTIETIVLNWQ